MTQAAGPTSEESDVCENEFYPIVKGASWSYQASGAFSEKFTRSITDVTPGGFTDQDIFSTGNPHIRQWKCEDNVLVAMQPDEAAAGPLQFSDRIQNFQTKQADGATVPDQFIPGAIWNEEIYLEGTSLVNGQDVPARDAIKLDCTAGNVESVSVPAGTFQAIRGNCKTDEKLVLNVGGSEQTSEIVTISTMWYASGVGLIKSQQAVAGQPGTTIELLAYKIP